MGRNGVEGGEKEEGRGWEGYGGEVEGERGRGSGREGRGPL